VPSVILLNLPQLSGLILPLSVFLGILLAYGRIYADSEMTIFHACGISEWYVTRVTLVFTTIMALICAVVTLYFSPMAAEYEYQVTEQAEAQSGLSSIIAGRFQETGNAKSVIFVEGINSDNTELQRVFVAQMPGRTNGENSGENGDETDPTLPQNRNATIVYAQSGHVRDENTGEQKLVLNQGRRYQGPVDQPSYEIVEFRQYEIQIREQEVERKRRKISAYPTSALLADTRLDAVAELHWRIGIPIAVFVLTFIAVPLSAVNPRQGKFAKMLPALGLYLGYFILLILGKSAIEDGKIPTGIGLWWVHATGLFVGSFLILKGRPIGSRFRATWLGFKH
ncbi:MAG: LPS export ABC transporter permease LptF, partial [Psychrosphaera sp.]|nr:LPS export ABC transporter permease LptF [Psychrosphaera sp.]